MQRVFNSVDEARSMVTIGVIEAERRSLIEVHETIFTAGNKTIRTLLTDSAAKNVCSMTREIADAAT